MDVSVTIDIEKVSRVFHTKDKTIEAVREVNLTISPGEFVSIIGPSGCGKSTLLRLVSGLIPVTSGEIRIGDIPVHAPYTDLGIAFQEPVLFDWKTIRENVTLQASVRGLDPVWAYQRANELLTMAGLLEFADRKPYELSGGMRQRASLCRALLHHPQLLLMDEPFGALDALTREDMASEVQDLWMQEKPTVICVTHSISEAVLLSDRVIVMSARPSRIVADISVKLRRPRNLVDVSRDDEFVDITSRIRELLGVGGEVAEL